MLWEEFRDQARQDLASCKFLFDEKSDYGNSAYLLQQTLEKYVKAYILKYDLFVREPYKFRHLPVEKMWEIIRNEIERKCQSYKKDIQCFITALKPLLELITNYFLKIRDPCHTDPRWKLSVWKQSLNLELNISEHTLFDELTNEMKTKFVPLIHQANELFSNAKIRLTPARSTQQRKLLQQLLDDIISVSLNIEIESRSHGIGFDNTFVNISIWFDKLEQIIKKTISLADSTQKEKTIQTPFMKVLLLAWLFSFREEMIATFPHEEIGRYPQLKDIRSREIYKNNVQNLETLIKRVSECCKRIEEMIAL